MSVIAMFTSAKMEKEEQPRGATLLLQYVNKHEFDYKIMPGDFLPGKYNFEFINMTDSAGNQHSLEDSDYFDRGYYFEIAGNSQADTTAPQLLGLKIYPEIAKPGDNVTIEAKVLEKSSLLALYSLIANLDGVENYVLQLGDWTINRNKDTFDCKAIFKIPESASNETWQIEILEILDNYFNLSYLMYSQDSILGSFQVTGGQTYPNRPPTWIIKNINLTVDAGKSLKYVIPNYIVSDIDGDQLSFSATTDKGNKLPAWIDFAANNLSLTLNPTNDNKGENKIFIYATDPKGLIDSLEVDITVNYIQQVIEVAVLQDTKINIYPNPAIEFITIECPFLIKSIKLYDLNGRVVYNEIGNVNTINVSGINKGIYILKAETDKMTIIEKIIKE